MSQAGGIAEFKKQGITVYLGRDDLPEHLRHYVREDDDAGGIRFFHHPLLVQLLPMGLPATIEEVLDIRAKAAADEIAQRKYGAHLFRYERPYRIDRLLELTDVGEFDTADRSELRSAAIFWQLAAAVWTDAETDESDPIWTALMHTNVPHRAFMSGIRGRRFIRGLSPTTTVYRGVPARSEALAAELIQAGWSWTTDRRVAAKFARRFCHAPDRPYIAKAVVDRSEIAACLLDRGESEILIEPWTVPDFTFA